MDQHWAIVNRIPIEQVQEMRRVAGMSDAVDGGTIANLDIQSLTSRHQILLVESSTTRCLRVHVLERSASGLRQVWSLDEVPRNSWSGRGLPICAQAPRPPAIHADLQGQIVIEIPTLWDEGQRSMPVAKYTYLWDGHTYVPAY